MLIGLNFIGDTVFESPIPKLSVKSVEVKNAVFDEIALQSASNDIVEKEKWGRNTVMLSMFKGDIEAGNIQMNERVIDKIRVKRRNVNASAFFKTVSEIAFDPAPTLIEYKDFTALSETPYEYVVVPVDETGVEGVMNAVQFTPEFEGWWLIDLDNPETNQFQFFYNLDDVNINIEEDRAEVSTFSKYPKVYYGKKRAKRGQLVGLVIPDGFSVLEQVNKLSELTMNKKPYLLKDSKGRRFMVDIYGLNETIYSRSQLGLEKVSLSWVEVGEYDDLF